MLDAVLRLAAARERMTIEEIARELAVSPAMAEQIFRELARYGYLERASACAAPCGGCSLKDACQAGREPRVWTVTAKGRRALERRA